MAETAYRYRGIPIHSFLNHFPIAFLLFSNFWDALYFFSKNEQWLKFSSFCLALGLLLSLPTIVIGFMDYARTRGGKKLTKTLNLHLFVVMTGLLIYLIAWLFRLKFGVSNTALALNLFAMATFLIGGRYGTILVDKFGIGRPTLRL